MTNTDEDGDCRLKPDLELRRWQSEALLNLQRIRHASERRLDELLREMDLQVTPAQANVLMILIAEKRPMTARQLAADMEVSEVTVGRFLKALERGDWISRDRDPDDARAILVRPTTAARAALPRFVRVSNAMLDVAFAGFDRDAVAQIVSMTRQVRVNLGRARREADG